MKLTTPFSIIKNAFSDLKRSVKDKKKYRNEEDWLKLHKEENNDGA